MRTKEELLHYLAKKYIWWKRPEDCATNRVVIQVMDIGEYDDVLLIVDCFGEEYLRQVIAQAEIGQLNARSWAYWHYRLHIIEPDQVPPPQPLRFKG